MNDNAKSREPRVLDYGPQRLIGISRICKTSVDCHNVWADESGFLARVGEIEAPAGRIPYYGLCRCATGARDGEFEYAAAMPVPEGVPAMEGMIEIIVPAGTYAEFSVERLHDIGQAWAYSGEWLAANPVWEGFWDGNPNGCGCVANPSFELYPPGFDGTGGLSVYVPIRSVRLSR
jgi:predicted transcriptional regulator YdeE